MKFTKETMRRALRTFMQAAAAYIAANLLVVDFTAESDVLKSALLGLVVSALAAGMAAVMNLEKLPMTEPEEPEAEPEVTTDYEQIEFDYAADDNTAE